MRVIPVQAVQQKRQSFTMVRPRDPSAGTSAKLAKAPEWRIDLNAMKVARSWQPEAYLFSRIIGQVGQVHNITANTVARGSLRPVYTDPVSGDKRTIAEILATEDDDDVDIELVAAARGVLRVEAAFTAPLGGQRELLRKAAINLSIGGETFLVASPIDATAQPPVGDSPELIWEFLSPLEIDPDRFGAIIRRRSSAMTSSNETLREGNYIARCWRSDPEHSEQPDCAMRHAIPDCRQYVKLREVIDSACDSRIPAGIIKIPEGLEAIGVPDDTDDPDEQGAAPFSETLFKHLTAHFTDPKSATRLVPLGVVGDPDDLKGLERLDLGEEQNASWASALRREVLHSILESLDPPNETVEGAADINHWSGFSIDAQFNSRVVIPLGDFTADFCTIAYLQAMLETYEEFTNEQSAAWSYEFDASDIVAKADRGVTAIRLSERDLLSDEATVLANGFSEADMPDEEELRTRRLIRIIIGAPALAPQLLPLVPGFEDIALVTPEIVAPTGPEVPAPPGGGDEPTGISGGDPQSGGGEPPMPGSPAPDASIVNLLLGMADSALDRAYSRAGSRAVARIDKSNLDPAKMSAADRLRSSDKRQALALLSEADLRALSVTREKLMDGAWDEFAVKAQGVLQPWVVSKLGRNGAYSLDVTRTLVDELCSHLQTLALDDCGTRTYEGGLQVPSQLIVRTLESVGPVRW